MRGIQFMPVLQASGATNFFGQGWWYHHFLRPFGLSFKGTTFVSKTTTLLPRQGNMPLRSNGSSPKELLPRCIIVKRKERVVLNAVGLSGPGLLFLLNTGRWQKRTKPFFISVMSLENTPEKRRTEIHENFRILSSWRGEFHAPFGVQLNVSCPNGGLNPEDLIGEVLPLLDDAKGCLHESIPLQIKVGPDTHPASAVKIEQHERCDGLVAFNTLRFGTHPTWATKTPPVDWKALFGTDDPKESPLAKRFPGCPGGLSGAPLLPLLCEWLDMTRDAGARKHINAGGGILSPHDADQVLLSGADSVFLGSIAMLAPTKVQKTVRYAQGHRQSRLSESVKQ